jgi:hypothetical protein
MIRVFDISNASVPKVVEIEVANLTNWTIRSPCLSDPKAAAIVTTAHETCSSATSPVFGPLLRHLATPPSVQHVFLDLSIVSLAASSPDSRIACDTIVLRAPNPSVASVIGKRFGWDPKRSSLSAQMAVNAPGSFSRPGDLIRDFWTWAELQLGAPSSRSSSFGSGYDSAEARPNLINTNADEKNMSLFFAEDEEPQNMEDETLVMIFQWSSHADGDRFKHPLQKSYGQNGTEIAGDMWDRHVAHPVRQLQAIGAGVDMLRLELRGVGPRLGNGQSTGRDRSGSRRFSTMASGLGERVGGFWSR